MKRFFVYFESINIRKILLCFCFGCFTVSGIALPTEPSSAILTGIITNAVTGSPVTGAKVVVNSHVTFSISGGFYTIVIDSTGTFPITCIKPGFDPIVTAPVTFQPGATVTRNFSLLESLNLPASVNAVLDTSTGTFIRISFLLPTGPYEVIYDDGIQDDFTVWANQGNMNAVRFTPVGYPAILTGGSVHIGNPGNYTPGCTPLVPFQIIIFDATGANNSPGNLIGGPFDVIPTALGWVEFQLSSPVTIGSGNFYIAMVQGGNSPNASGLAIDQTNPQYRSYSRFITGGMPWMPAQGNFMMRAVINGPGGPLNMADLPGGITAYQVVRLRQGEELNPAVWNTIGTTTTLFSDDNGWPALPCGPYRWGVKAIYSGNRVSPPTFSNVIGKCWTFPVSIHVNLTCPASAPDDAYLQMKNLVYPDTLYSTILDSTGFATFPEVWKGVYEIQVRKFGYLDYYQTYSVDVADTVEVMVLQKKSPPSNLLIDDRSLFSVWDVPYFHQLLFDETWVSGDFSTQGWSLEGNHNWKISTSAGNPAPSALFSWNPPVINYEQSLVSKEIPGEYSPILTLTYDLFLDNFSTAALNQLAVEVNYGSVWYTLKIWNNAGGSILWTHDEIDISQFSDKAIRIRFRAFGEDSYQINGWNIDNITVFASESAHMLAPCILGYNFYIDGALVASVSENNFTIPGEFVKYDSTYNGCVVAIYGSGYSEAVCDYFTSHFLWPPTNITGIPVGENAFLSWEKPAMPTDSGTYITPPGLLGYNILRNDSLICFLSYPDSLSFHDPALEPGTYSYFVSARYDLTAYGFPGQQGNSSAAGPALVEINYGLSLPFFEPWDQGEFTYNDWRFTYEQGNWNLPLNEGNPPPSAAFTGLPLRTGYSYSLESTVLDASSLNCAKIWFDFDIRLQDIAANSNEELSAEIYHNGNWHRKGTWKNTGSFGWTPAHIEISSVKGKGFRIRFNATGLQSSDILDWSIDNINVYAVCLPASNLTGEPLGNDVQLRWSPPWCNEGGIILNEGFENPEFPPIHWSQVINNSGATWSHTDYASPVGVHSGNYSAGINWDYDLQDEWIIAHDIFVNGNLQFWSMAYQGSTHGDHYYVKVSTDNGVTWETLFDLSALPPYSGGYNQWQAPYTIDLSAYLGDVIDIAWHADDGNGQGCWYYWAIDDCSVGSKKLDLFSSETMYNVYRKDPGDPSFFIVNPQPISDTSYLDNSIPSSGLYNYFIQVVNEACSRSMPSDTIAVDIITLVDHPEEQNLQIYPNPANNQLIIKSVFPVARVYISDMAGRALLEIPGLSRCEIQLSVAGLPSGLYMMKISYQNNLISRLVSIIH